MTTATLTPATATPARWRREQIRQIGLRAERDEAGGVAGIGRTSSDVVSYVSGGSIRWIIQSFESVPAFEIGNSP